MVSTPTVIATEPWRDAILAVDALLGRLRTERAFVGTVAASAWLGRRVEGGSVDVLVTLSPEGRTQVPMMASNWGFAVDREEVEAAEQLDLVPLRYGEEGSRVRIHVLIGSNALYGTMVRDAVDATLEENGIRVVSAEDFALLLTVADDDASIALREELISRAGDAIDLARLNERLTSIGLSRKTLTR